MLGAMGYELDSQARERLRAVYARMSDGELLNLAASPGDLTDMARDALRQECKTRDLQLVWSGGEPGTERRGNAHDLMGGVGTPSAAPLSASIVGSSPDLGLQAEGDLQRDEVLLRTFHDSFEMAKACESLESAEIGFRVQDVSNATDRANGYAPVALNLIVATRDREHAMAVLRAELGLFPLQEVAEPDTVVDDGTVSQVGYFGRREDANEIAGVLQEAGIWNRMVANPEGSVDTEDAWVVEVREVDLMRAGDVVEKALG